MVLAGLLVLVVCAADAIRRPRSSWRGERDRAAWLGVILLSLPVLLLSVLGPFLVLAVSAMYVVRRTAVMP